MDPKNIKPWKFFKKVLPQHTDHAGLMWHGSYVLFLEESRIEALQNVGLSYSDLSLQGYEMPVVSLNINFKKAISHGDIVCLHSYSLPRKLAKFSWQTSFIIRDNIIFAEANVDLVLTKKKDDKHNLVRRIPENLLPYFSSLSNGPV